MRTPEPAAPPSPRRRSGCMTRVNRQDIERVEMSKRDTIPAPPPAFDELEDLEPPTLRSR